MGVSLWSMASSRRSPSKTTKGNTSSSSFILSTSLSFAQLRLSPSPTVLTNSASSTDSHFCHLAWVNTPRKQGGLGSLDIPLLADKSASISKSYGVYKEDEGLSFRGLFIIDEQQRLRQITINDLPVGRSVDETLRLVQAFQFTDKHGEVCPADGLLAKKL